MWYLKNELTGEITEHKTKRDASKYIKQDNMKCYKISGSGLYCYESNKTVVGYVFDSLQFARLNGIEC